MINLVINLFIFKLLSDLTISDLLCVLIIFQDSFPNLERLVLDGLEIWNGPLPVQLFSKLKLLNVAGSMSKSVVFLDSLLPDLEGNNQSSAVGMGAQLPNLRELRLFRMHKLMHLGEEEDNSQSARPNFPNLEILFLNACHSLRNLRSSAIPFNNLTYLSVSSCRGLKYLITYSMAKSLIHLTKLEVGGCRRLVEIVGNNEDDDDSGNYEITFRRLKHLKLSFLPRLRGFCSRGDCSVKFPSLETLSISNRLKLKIFQTIGDETLQTTNEEEDTDVDRWGKFLLTNILKVPHYHIRNGHVNPFHIGLSIVMVSPHSIEMFVHEMLICNGLCIISRGLPDC